MDSKFTVYCKMTCLGGSEKGTCLCTSPKQCHLTTDIEYKHARNEAIARMARHIKNLIKSTL